MKTNIKMRVTHEQSKRVQEICFNNKFKWIDSGYKIVPTEYIFIGSKDIRLTRDNNFFDEYDFIETDADLFIRTNGTCEENNSSIDYETLRLSHLVLNSKYEELEQKLKKKNEILKKARIKRKNQREELNKLNLKLQKCISLEEHNKIIEKINKGNVNYLSNSIISRDKEIEKLKAVIEYLESKIK